MSENKESQREWEGGDNNGMYVCVYMRGWIFLL